MKERLVETAISLGASYFLYQLLLYKFSIETRHKIKERDQGICQGCGADGRMVRLEASHLNHRRGKNYDTPENGELLCIKCHYQFHLDHRGKAKEIGLREDQNNWAIQALWGRMDEWDKDEFRTKQLSYL